MHDGIMTLVHIVCFPPHQMRCWSEEPYPSCYMQGDIILVGLRDYQDEKADVILKCATMPCNRACCSSLMLVEQLMLRSCLPPTAQVSIIQA